MAFDLVSYLRDQVELNCPDLHAPEKSGEYRDQLNFLSLGKLVDAYRQSPEATYQDIKSQDELHIQHLARMLTTSAHNQSEVARSTLEHDLTHVLKLHIKELNQLDQTANLGQHGVAELLEGQIEHLSGQADDWVWSTNNLTQLIGSKKIIVEPVSLDTTLKEFNTMVHQTPTTDTVHTNTEVFKAPTVPTWAKIIEPLVALIILWVLYAAYTQYVA